MGLIQELKELQKREEKKDFMKEYVEGIKFKSDDYDIDKVIEDMIDDDIDIITSSVDPNEYSKILESEVLK